VHSPAGAAFALSFTESPAFVRPTASDDSSYPSANTTFDGVQPAAVAAPGPWTQPASWLRGGFRYLTLVSTSPEFAVANVSCALSFAPHVADLRAYAGYFAADDPRAATRAPGEAVDDADFLTKVWYAGAYTVQTNTVPLDTGRAVPFHGSPGKPKCARADAIGAYACISFLSRLGK
jgi:hypothetical protein